MSWGAEQSDSTERFQLVVNVNHHPLTHPPTHPPTNSPTHPPTHPLTHPLTHSPITHPSTHPLTHPLTHPPTHPLTHPLTTHLPTHLSTSPAVPGLCEPLHMNLQVILCSSKEAFQFLEEAFRFVVKLCRKHMFRKTFQSLTSYLRHVMYSWEPMQAING